MGKINRKQTKEQICDQYDLLDSKCSDLQNQNDVLTVVNSKHVKDSEYLHKVNIALRDEVKAKENEILNIKNDLDASKAKIIATRVYVLLDIILIAMLGVYIIEKIINWA